MIKPGCYKLHHYIEDILLWCECNNSKNKLYYYFPITKEDIEENMEMVKVAYERNVPTITLLDKILQKKRGGNNVII